MFYCLAEVPLPLVRVIHRVLDAQVMLPWDLCNNLLHKFCVRVRLGKSAHVLEIARREAFHLGKGMTKVRHQTIDHFSSPAAVHLLGNELTPTFQ